MATWNEAWLYLRKAVSEHVLAPVKHRGAACRILRSEELLHQVGEDRRTSTA